MQLTVPLAQRRPVILCEYAHAMGNSGGSLDSYWVRCWHARCESTARIYSCTVHSPLDRKHSAGKALYKGALSGTGLTRGLRRRTPPAPRSGATRAGAPCRHCTRQQ